MMQHLASERPSPRGLPARRLVAILAALTAGAAAVAAVMTVRSALSLAEGRRALTTGEPTAAVQAFDRSLAEAPPFVLPVRRRARAALERLALDDSDPTSAWYATLSLISAVSGEEKRRWHIRSLELAPHGAVPADSASAFIPVDPTPPSAAWSALAVASLIGWVAALAAWLAAPWPWARSPRTAVAAGLLWLLWLAAMISA